MTTLAVKIIKQEHILDQKYKTIDSSDNFYVANLIKAALMINHDPKVGLTFFSNGPTPASFLFIFVLFNNNFTEKL